MGSLLSPIKSAGPLPNSFTSLRSLAPTNLSYSSLQRRPSLHIIIHGLQGLVRRSPRGGRRRRVLLLRLRRRRARRRTGGFEPRRHGYLRRRRGVLVDDAPRRRPLPGRCTPLWRPAPLNFNLNRDTTTYTAYIYIAPTRELYLISLYFFA